MSATLTILLRTAIFILVALALCGLIFQAAGYSALDMFASILDGAFLRKGGLSQCLRWALPLFITATGVVLSFRCGFFNIGAQGQFYMGAIAATAMASWLNGMPVAVLVPVSILSGMAGGALWALWPGILRFRWGTDEVITTLMGNFIAGLILVYVTTGPLKDPSGSGQQSSSKPLAAAYRISNSMGLSPTIIAISLVVGIGMWLLINRTAFGVLGGLAGRNPEMLRWQGARMWKFGLASFMVSGALAGLAGAIEVFGPNGRLVGGFLPTHGFTAVLIALVANLSITGTAVAALFFGGLASAALYLPIMAGLPSAAIDIINAAIALFITAKSRMIDRMFSARGKTP
ncbi:ABC transporter [Rhizobium rhizosphaerae]|uniref:ABC transporter n=1 Tax=Xaviernesmea rhizosphaerae TaxID=1672749 RepID=A0A1Q9AHT9_9HYPH|nr:ABC transporter permease [Xaviernesmea rhizosphaerae]OLP54776.1 ABC transporter [Xaviernesmea rhizosphaerae]